MNVHRIKVAVGAIALSSLFLTATTNAVPLQTTVNNGTSQSFYDGNISATDLINAGSPALGTFTFTGGDNFPASGTINGNGVNTSGLSYWGNATSVTLTYTLTGSPTGYDINSINSIYGWGDSRGRHAAQRYSIAYTTVSNPIFTLLDTVVYDPFNDAAQGSTQVTIIDSVAKLATGVTALRFTLLDDPGEGSSEVGVVREFDVFGNITATAAIPEPASIVLWSSIGLGLLGFGCQRLRRT